MAACMHVQMRGGACGAFACVWGGWVKEEWVVSICFIYFVLLAKFGLCVAFYFAPFDHTQQTIIWSLSCPNLRHTPPHLSANLALIEYLSFSSPFPKSTDAGSDLHRRTHLLRTLLLQPC